jgi:2'-5' RNA ligase
MTRAPFPGFRTGQTALVIPVPEAESLVSAWRNQFDPAAAVGTPAHITILFPFLAEAHANPAVLAELGAILARHPAFDLRLTECRRFPGVLYLAPEPDVPFRALTADVAARWPEAPPYGGQFAEVIPHLTVAGPLRAVDEQEPRILGRIEADLTPRLPIKAHAAAVVLLAYDGQCWRQTASFPLAASSPT